MNTDQSTAKAVRDAMEMGGMTQLRLSEVTGIPRTTLLRRLGGHDSFTVAELTAVAEALEVPLASLIPGLAEAS